MAYNVLVKHLWPVADGAQVLLRREWGVGRFRIEEKPDPLIQQIATLHATMRDHHILWVEVSDRPYPKHLDAILLDCVGHALPIRIVVAVPSGLSGSIYNEDLTRARQKGVGVVTVRGNGGTIIENPLSMSLLGVRPINRSAFPQKYRYGLSQAEATFRGGNPPKGCDDMYGIIEDLSRKIAKKTFDLGYWRANANPPRFERDPWAAVMQSLVHNLNPAQCPYFNNNVLHRVLGVTPLRNQAVHVPKNKADLTRRDRELKTRFEDSEGLLLELVRASRPLRI